MEQVTDRIFTETKVRGCNPSFVLTSKGPVVIDTPQLPTKAVEMRKLVEEHGTIQYVINTEHHVDHIFGNYWFKGAGPIIHHQGVHERFMTVFPELDPFEYALEALPTDDPDGAALVPDRETYYANMGTADIVFNGDVTLKVGDRTFHLLHTPGHTPGQVAVYVPEERAVFTGDTIFSECTTWLMTSDVDQWITALDRIRALDIDHVIPGHGPVQTKAYLATQRSFMLEWKAAVAVAVAKGWSREETMARVNFAERYPVDIGQEYMMDYIQERNAGALYDKLTAPTATTYPAMEPPKRWSARTGATDPPNTSALAATAASKSRELVLPPSSQRTTLRPRSWLQDAAPPSPGALETGIARRWRLAGTNCSPAGGTCPPVVL